MNANIIAQTRSALLALLLLSTATSLMAEVYVIDFDRSRSEVNREELLLQQQSRHLSKIFAIDSDRIARNASLSDGLAGYVDSLAPQVVDKPFKVLLRFNNYVMNLTQDDLVSNNARIQQIIGSGTLFSLLLVPEAYSIGDITLQLRGQSVVDIAGNVNQEPSNILLRSSIGSLRELNFIADGEVDQRQVDYAPVRVEPREVDLAEFGFRVLE